MLTVNRVRRVCPLLVDVAKVGKVGRERVTIKKDDMLGVDCADCFVHALVKADEGRVRWVCGFVEGVVSRDPLVSGIVLRELGPQPDRAVLKVFVDPKVGDVSARVAVPVRVLSSGCGVEVEEGVDTLLGTEIDDPVEVFEALLLEYVGVHVILGIDIDKRTKVDVSVKKSPSKCL